MAGSTLGPCAREATACYTTPSSLHSFPRKINQVALRGIETYLNKTELAMKKYI